MPEHYTPHTETTILRWYVLPRHPSSGDLPKKMMLGIPETLDSDKGQARRQVGRFTFS